MPEFVHLTNLSHDPSDDYPWFATRKEIIPLPPARVWRALTDPAELTRWWCDRAEVDLQPGGRYAFGGGHVVSLPTSPGGAEVERRGDFEILELEPQERLRYRWWLGDVETEVTFELENQLELTNLRVTQTARKELAWSRDLDTPNWWWVALPSLRIFAESGHAAFRLDYEAAGRIVAGATGATGAPGAPVELAVDVFTFPWVIWQKLTDPKELERWWAASPEVALEPGGAYELRQPLFQLAGEGPRTVFEIGEHQKLVHDWTWNDDSPPGQLAWTIEETDVATRVTLRDHGPWPPNVSPTRVAIDRAVLLLYLKQISERGVTPLEYQR